MIPYMVGKLAPNSSHLTRGSVKSVPGRGYFRDVPSQNGDKYVTSPPPSIVELVTPCANWLVGNFSCDGMLWEKRGGGPTRQPVGPPVGTAAMTAVMSVNCVGLGSFSSRCWTFRRTHTSTDPIRVLCTRLALPLNLSLLSRLAPSTRLAVGVPPRALWLAA